MACTPAPEGHDHWTLRALAGKTVELGLVESLSHETVRLRLKKGSQAVAQEAVVHPEAGALRNSSGVGEGIYKLVVKSDGEFLNIGVGDRQ